MNWLKWSYVDISWMDRNSSLFHLCQTREILHAEVECHTYHQLTDYSLNISNCPNGVLICWVFNNQYQTVNIGNLRLMFCPLICFKWHQWDKIMQSRYIIVMLPVVSGSLQFVWSSAKWRLEGRLCARLWKIDFYKQKVSY